MVGYDGVVVDSLEVLSMALIEACARVGLESISSLSDVLALFENDAYARLREMGVGDAGIEEITRKSAQALRNALPWLKPFPLMPQLLDELGDTHHLVIVTASREDVVWSFLHRHRIFGVADVHGVGAGENTFEKVSRLVQEAPGQPVHWFVGATVGDVRAAQHAGAMPCGVAWGWHEPDAMMAAGAARVVESPPELLEVVAPGLAADFWD